MHSFTHAEAGVSEALWAQVSALQDVRSAMTALDTAGAALVGLVDDSDWRSDGVRALNELLRRLTERTGEQRGALAVREWELERVVAL